MDKHSKVVFLSAGIVGAFLVVACAGTIAGLIHQMGSSVSVTTTTKKGTGTKAAPKVVAVSVKAPPRVKQGETFAIEVTVDNQTSRRAKLYSLDISNSLANGFTTNLIDPPPSGTESNAASRVLLYDRPVLAGEQLTVVFTCTAGKEGYYRGDFDVYINNADNLESHTLHLAIGDAGDKAMKNAGVTDENLKAQVSGSTKASSDNASDEDHEESDED